MSANIYFRQVRPIDSESLSVYAPSSFIESMTEAFGVFPCILGANEVPVLKGMAALNRDGGGNPYSELIEAINKYGTVEVYAEY